MPGLGDWRPYETHVQGGLPEGNFLNGQFALLCAGPPFYNMIAQGTGGGGDLSDDFVYPIGMIQNFALSQNKGLSRIFEIGSDRSYFISGRSVGQISLGRVVYHGPNLLRALWAYYQSDAGDNASEGREVRPLITQSIISPLVNPFATGGTGDPPRSAGLHRVRIPPGDQNMFLNLASDLFSQPIGLMLVLRDNELNNMATLYFEQCYVPSATFAFDSQGLIIQESCGVMFERIQTIPNNALQVIDGVLNDDTGGWQ